MALTDTACRNCKPGEKARKLADGGGLYLYVAPTGGKLWRVDCRYDGKRRTLSLGAYPRVSLAEARGKRDTAKKQLAEGIDPCQAEKERRRAARVSENNTFESIAREWYALQVGGWTTDYGRHVMSRFEADIFPLFGKRPIAEIEAPEILDALRAVERRGALEIAKRLRQTIGQVFRYAIVTGRASRDPAADLKGALRRWGGRGITKPCLAGIFRASFLNLRPMMARHELGLL